LATAEQDQRSRRARCRPDGEAVQRALARSDGNVSAAAEALGISRATLHRKLRRLDLNRAH
jgi:transcriptional regulator of acetoin/glycerol metabolism